MTLRPTFKLRFLLLAAGITYLWPAGGQANAGLPAPFANLDAIDAEIAGFAGHTIGQTGGASMPVDRRLRLNACRSPLALSWRMPRRDSVMVECPDAGSWRLFVPVHQAESGATAVARGEAVTIALLGDGFSVSQAGEAMDAGAVGDWIRVRGLKNGQAQGDTMRARVSRPGEVVVELRD